MPFTEEELSFITEVQHDYDKYKLHQKLWPIDLKGIQKSVRKIIVIVFKRLYMEHKLENDQNLNQRPSFHKNHQGYIFKTC